MLKAMEVSVAVVVYAATVKVVTYATAMALSWLLVSDTTIEVQAMPEWLKGSLGGRESELVTGLWMGGGVASALTTFMGGASSMAALAGLDGVSELIGMTALNALGGGTIAVTWG